MRHRLLLLALTALLIVPAAAQAADSHAPHGARLDWLPSDEWVMSAWLPYDEARLYALVHTDRAEVDAWLDDHRTLRPARAQARLDLAAQAGPRARRAAPEGRAPGDARVLERRALETLTQGHLSNHVIFHVFHTPAIADHAKTVFGLRPATFRHLRDSGLSPAAIAQRGGRTRAGAQARLAALLKARGERARAARRDEPRAGQGALRRADGGAAGLHGATPTARRPSRSASSAARTERIREPNIALP